MTDQRIVIFNTQQYEGFLPCPFCGSRDQTVRESKCSWLSSPVVFTVSACCNRCGLEMPIEVEFDELPYETLTKMIRDRVDDIKRRWNTRWSECDG